MRRPIIVLLAVLLPVLCVAASSGGKVSKVLPFFLDLKGRHALSPSLYDRDAYQAQLRKDPSQRSGMRFDVSYKAPASFGGGIKVRVELRGVAEGNLPHEAKLEQEVKSGSGWVSLKITDDEYKKLGEVTAWRATVWDGDQLIGEQKSFLW